MLEGNTKCVFDWVKRHLAASAWSALRWVRYWHTGSLPQSFYVVVEGQDSTCFEVPTKE